MKLVFKIAYRTVWGQRLRLSGSLSELGAFDEEKARDMNLTDSDKNLWELEVSLPGEKTPSFDYRYFVEDENTGFRIYECADRHFLLPNKGADAAEIHDQWRSAPDEENTLFSSAFTEALLKPKKIWKDRFVSFEKQKEDEYIVRFQIHIARIDPRHRVGITGNAASLGKWKPEKGLLMTNSGHPKWRAEMKIKKKDLPIQYKYFIYDPLTKTSLFFEYGDNRILELPGETGKNKLFVQGDERFRFPKLHWKGAGISIPVFSLRRKNSFGIGEFTDIKLLVDWAKKTGMKMIQLLPVNDTVATHSWMDSYPYAAISVFALHPVYANIEKIGALKSDTANKIIKERGRHLDSNQKVDYEGVMLLKSRYFKMLFDEQKNHFLKKKEFLDFFEDNKSWLKPYAAFSYLRDLFNTPNFSKWGIYSKFNPGMVDEITSPDSDHYDDIAIHYFIQYHLHQQLEDAANYARQNGIILKGDIPIGIYRNSVDAWQHPDLFQMDKQAGAPPDDFSVKGQNWGFPTYNWHEMEKNGFQWWTSRLHKLSQYFDAFRIDHILGFFRIWEIQLKDVEGLMGYFNPSLAYSVHDLERWGIFMDEERFCQPYIREHFLHERFGDLTSMVKAQYLDEYLPGHFRMKPEYDTQQKIADTLKTDISDSMYEKLHKENLRDGLFSLVSEVLFIKNPYDPAGKSYYPRNSLHQTRSYQDLEQHQKQAINNLYVDYFYRRNEELWRQQANIKLPAIKKATNMLICGEDLGMVPKVVPSVMRDLGILSLEIQRMPKNIENEFNHPNDYPYLSVASPSTHDMSTIRGWWEEDPARSQRFFNQILGNEGNSPFFCEPWIVKQILEQHFYSPSMWAVIPFQDLLGVDGDLRRKDAREERINIPANPKHYWRYRMHLTIEELSGEETFNATMRQMLKNAGRIDAY
jgi:4-alpha-glucanotransferase